MNKYQTVDDFLISLTEERRKEVETLRKILTTLDANLTEHIKWNSPSYIYEDEDRLTFNMRYPDRTMLLLHMGATRKEDKKGEPIMKDESGLITWNSDIRGTLSFTSLEQIEAQRPQIETLITRWLSVQ